MYQVHSVKYDIQFYPSSDSAVTTTANTFMVGIMQGAEDISTMYTLNDDLLEAQNNKYFRQQLAMRNGSTKSASGALPFISGFGTKPANKNMRFCGRTYIRDLVKTVGLANAPGTVLYNWPADYCARVISNPAAQMQLVLFAYSIYEGQNYAMKQLPYLYALVRLEYDVELFMNTQPGPSTFDEAPISSGNTGGFLGQGGTGLQA